MVSQGARVRGTLRHFFENMFCQKMQGYTFLKIFISCSNIPHWMLYPYVSSKCLILKIRYMFGGSDFFRLKVPQSPLLGVNTIGVKQFASQRPSRGKGQGL